MRSKSEYALLQGEIEKEQVSKPERTTWMSLSAISQALMLSLKKQNRFGKDQYMNAFVLTQKSRNNGEFTQFLNDLKKNAAQIPAGTRIQLAVATQYIDPAYFPNASLYNRWISGTQHWTAIDLVVEANGRVSSFVLDAANSHGFQNMHNDLKATFPEGDHYVYEMDQRPGTLGGKLDDYRRIQTQGIGCQVFVTEHLRQLSQIDTYTLYTSELPKISQKTKQSRFFDEANGVIKIVSLINATKDGYFSALKKFELTRVFRGIQSWKTLDSLSNELKNTVIKSGETLLQAANKYSTDITNKYGTKRKVNKFIEIKNDKYLKRKKEYFESLDQSTVDKILNNRQGFQFLHNPILFTLNKALSDMDQARFEACISTLCKKLEETAPKNRKLMPFFKAQHIGMINQNIVDLRNLITSNKDLKVKKNELILSMAELFRYLDQNNSIRTKPALVEAISSGLNLSQEKNASVEYRKSLSEGRDSLDAQSRSDTASTNSDDENHI